MVERAWKMSLLGLTNVDIAAILGVKLQTLVDWCTKYPLFQQALERGRVEATANVAHSLYQAATGYEYYEEVVVQAGRFSRKVRLLRHRPPNVQAAMFWLKNRTKRLPEPWTDTMHLAPGAAMPAPNLSDFTEDELRMLATIGVRVTGNREPVLLEQMPKEDV
jgi:hypothetical protein